MKFLKKEQFRVLVIDTGLAFDHALRFVRDGGKVYYCTFECYDDSFVQFIGCGFGDRVERVYDFSKVVDEVDFVYVTDVRFSWLCSYLRERGTPTYGPSPVFASLEDDKIYSHIKLNELGVHTPKGTVVKGLRSLKDYVKKSTVKPLYVKLNKYRGNLETFCVNEPDELDSLVLSAAFGPYVEEIDFLVQEPCEGVEVGIDALVCSGRVIEPFIFTVEKKAVANIGVWQNYNPIIEQFYEKVLPLAKESDYRGNLSVEGFWDSKVFTVIDVCSRNAYPSSSFYVHFIENFSEVMYSVACNKEVELKIDHNNPFMSQLVVESSPETWRKLDKIDINEHGLSLRRVYRNGGGELWFVPGNPVVFVLNEKGSSLHEALERLTKRTEKFSEGFMVDSSFGQFFKDQINRLNALGGIDFAFDVQT